MKYLKSLIAVYEIDNMVIKGHYFNVVRSRDLMKDGDDSLFELSDKGHFIAGTIRSYKGLIEIAEAYLTGDKQTLADAEAKNCLIY